MRRLISILILTLALCKVVDAQQIAIKTNVLSDAVLTPNLGLELVTGDHTSLDLSFFGNYIPFWVNSTVLGFQPEFRYWFNGRPLTREYVGLTALATMYDVTFGGNIYDGEAVGGGISGGYVINLSERWNFEMSAGVGVMFFNQKKYKEDDNYEDYFSSGGSNANVWGYKLLPVKLGLSFSYIIR
jgi:hypothetical protein